MSKGVLCIHGLRLKETYPFYLKWLRNLTTENRGGTLSAVMFNRLLLFICYLLDALF